MPALCMASLEKKKQEELQGGLQESEVGYIYSRKLTWRWLEDPPCFNRNYISNKPGLFFGRAPGICTFDTSAEGVNQNPRVSRCQNRLNLSCIPQKGNNNPKPCASRGFWKPNECLESITKGWSWNKQSSLWRVMFKVFKPFQKKHFL